VQHMLMNRADAIDVQDLGAARYAELDICSRMSAADNRSPGAPKRQRALCVADPGLTLSDRRWSAPVRR
jgi:hypothetical protein